VIQRAYPFLSRRNLFAVRPQIWIQGFRLGPEDKADIHEAVRSAREAGVEDLWTWGYEACGHMSYLGTREPVSVWAVLSEALTKTGQ
jgi:hypothetical protein